MSIFAGGLTHDRVEESGPEMDGGMDAQEDEDMADDEEVADVGNVGAISKVLPFTAESLPSGLFMAG